MCHTGKSWEGGDVAYRLYERAARAQIVAFVLTHVSTEQALGRERVPGQIADVRVTLPVVWKDYTECRPSSGGGGH